MCKAPWGRPINQSSNQQGFQLIKRSHNIVKSEVIMLLWTIHIKHNGVIFQTSEEFLPNQFLHPNNKSAIVGDKTQWALNIFKTMLHKPYATSQWHNEWSTISPLHLHIQNQLTKEKLLLRRRKFWMWLKTLMGIYLWSRWVPFSFFQKLQRLCEEKLIWNSVLEKMVRRLAGWKTYIGR